MEFTRVEAFAIKEGLQLYIKFLESKIVQFTGGASSDDYRLLLGDAQAALKKIDGSEKHGTME